MMSSKSLQIKYKVANKVWLVKGGVVLGPYKITFAKFDYEQCEDVDYLIGRSNIRMHERYGISNYYLAKREEGISVLHNVDVSELFASYEEALQQLENNE